MPIIAVMGSTSRISRLFIYLFTGILLSLMLKFMCFICYERYISTQASHPCKKSMHTLFTMYNVLGLLKSIRN